MEKVQQYDPLKWPPSYQLAELHLKCVCPGKDNIDGIQCPCCGRFEKVKLKHWLCRSVLKDFKNYGGAIPGYVQLVKYCWVVFAILTVIVVLYHIYAIQVVCPLIDKKYESDKKLLQQYKCQPFLVVFKMCDPVLIYDTLRDAGRNEMATILLALQLFSFCFLIFTTVGMKLWLQRVNFTKIEREQRVYSQFSLILKNIPKFYQLENIKLELQQIVPGINIHELFFVYQIAQFQVQYKKLFDLYYEILYIKDSVATQRGETKHNLQNKIDQYIKLHEKVEQLRKRLGVSNGKAIVVFNTIQERDAVYKRLHVNECSKFIYHTFKLFGYNTMNLHFFADKILEPHEINWKFIGQASQKKNQLKIVTSLLGFGFIVICFLLFYFPMIKVRQLDIENHSVAITILSLVISLILQIIAIGYRLFILRIIPMRQPSSRQAQSYFIVMTTVVFHFLFYLIVPGTYYEITARIPNNIKLKQLFIAVVIFLIMTIIVGFFNLRYRLFNNRRKNIMSSYSGWGKFCQMRLHEQIRWPSFPIEYKIMVILNIWSFNAYYTFQIPYLMLFFLVTISIIIFIDKRILYNHYKMQVFQSIQALLSIQRDYIIMFLICVCCGYALAAIHIWQYIVTGVLFVLCLLVNGLIALNASRKEKMRLKQRAMTLSEVLKGRTNNLDQSFMSNLRTAQIKQNMLSLDRASTVSLGSAIFENGYKQIYENYLNQFRNKQINHLLEVEYKKLKSQNYNLQDQINELKKMSYQPSKSRISEMKKLQKKIGEKDKNDDNDLSAVQINKKAQIEGQGPDQPLN